MLMSMALVLFLTLLSSGTLSSSKSAGSPSIVSSSSSEQQLKLCVEGRASTYGDPPSQAQQAACTKTLADQIAGSGSESAPHVPSGPAGITSTTFGFPTG